MSRGKKVMLCVTAIVLLLGIPIWRYLLLSKKAYSSFRPYDTGAIADGVFAIRDDFVNVYAVKTGNSYIVFDGGSNAPSIAKGLDALGIDPQKVSDVFLTHTDYDHIAAVSLFPAATIFISDKEADIASGKAHRLLFLNNKVPFAYSTLRDGEILRRGGRTVQVFVTPGHTLGSACYLVDGKYLVTGDMLSVEDGKIQTHCEVFNMDTELQKKSIGALSRNPALVNVTAFLTAHYGVQEGAQSLFDEWSARDNR